MRVMFWVSDYHIDKWFIWITSLIQSVCNISIFIIFNFLNEEAKELNDRSEDNSKINLPMRFTQNFLLMWQFWINSRCVLGILVGRGYIFFIMRKIYSVSVCTIYQPVICKRVLSFQTLNTLQKFGCFWFLLLVW